MKLRFRQGLARYQTDTYSSPTFLQRSEGAGDFIDLVVSPDPTVVAFAHRSSNYIVEEIRTVSRAWGPIPPSVTSYLFWDINLVTGQLSRGLTTLPIIYAGTPPPNPAIDQHWFDSSEVVMRVWNGAKWVEKIRVFAGAVLGGSTIHAYPMGESQAGFSGDFEGGNIILDSYNKPLRQSDGTFVTTTTSLLITNNSTKKIQFETEVLNGMAAESLPKFTLIQFREGRELVMARSNDPMSRVAGIVLEDLYKNEVGTVITDGLIRNENWNFPGTRVNRPVFCGPNGEVTVSPPQVGVSQIIGFVYDTDAVYLKIQSPIILDDLTVGVAPPAPPPAGLPIVNFYASPVSGDAPLTVTFISTTLGNPTSLEWDFTNDGTIDGTGSPITYTFAAPGVYNVRLRATNNLGAAEIVKPAAVQVTVPPPTPTKTNIGIRLGGPSQVQRNVPFPLSVTTTNDGGLAATSVVRTLTIPDFGGQQIQITSLPTGSDVSYSLKRTIIVLPTISTLGIGVTHGPQMLMLTAPTAGGQLTVFAEVVSPEADVELSNNSTSLSILVKP